MSIYVDIFTNSTQVASILPIGSEAGLYAMKSFGKQPMLPAIAIATLGAMLGQMINYYIGTLFLEMARKSEKGVNEESYARMQNGFGKYGVFLLLLCWVMMGNLVVVAAGYLKAPLKIVFPLVFLGTACHYAFDLL